MKQSLSLLILFFCLSGVSYTRLVALTTQSTVDAKNEVLYLPSGKGLRLISFGYKNALSDILWFYAINYFGKHYASDRNYKWLAHMCELVTELNPRAKHVFEFGGMMLAWEANAAEQSIALVTKGIEKNPTSWSLYYLRGFNYMYFLQDDLRAKDDFITAAKLPGAPAFIAALASKKLANLNSPAESIKFLEQMLNITTDSSARTAIAERLNEAKFAFSISILEAASQEFVKRSGRQPKDITELVNLNILPRLPQDPYGGSFFIEEQSGTVRSTSGREVAKSYKDFGSGKSRNEKRAE